MSLKDRDQRSTAPADHIIALGQQEEKIVKTLTMSLTEKEWQDFNMLVVMQKGKKGEMAAQAIREYTQRNSENYITK